MGICFLNYIKKIIHVKNLKLGLKHSLSTCMIIIRFNKKFTIPLLKIEKNIINNRVLQTKK